VGDAVGAPVEFLSIRDIRSTRGEDGIRALEAPGHFTDDTQMTLFTTEALIIAGVLLDRDGQCAPRNLLHHGYLRWLATQAERLPSISLSVDEPLGWLLDIELLHRVEAPGATCLSALASGELGTLQSAINDSKGCGGVMRAAPGGLLVPGAGLGSSPEEAYHLGCEIAAVTHGHPDGIHPAGALAALICCLMAEASLEQALRTVRDLSPAHQATWLASAEEIGRDGLPSPELIAEELGGGWVGDEALAIAVACAVGAEEFDEGDDFPLFSIRVSKAVVDSEDLGADCKGLIFGAVGAGEVITANKVSGARAVAGVSEHFIRYSREHGNTNVLVIGAQLQSLDEAKKLIQVFFETDYSTVIDDTRRILHATEYENSGTIEGWLIER